MVAGRGQIRESFGEELIEDLWLNFFCTSTCVAIGIPMQFDWGVETLSQSWLLLTACAHGVARVGCSNLSSGEVAVHTAGSVATYVRAAMSVVCDPAFGSILL